MAVFRQKRNCILLPFKNAFLWPSWCIHFGIFSSVLRIYKHIVFNTQFSELRGPQDSPFQYYILLHYSKYGEVNEQSPKIENVYVTNKLDCQLSHLHFTIVYVITETYFRELIFWITIYFLYNVRIKVFKTWSSRSW